MDTLWNQLHVVIMLVKLNVSVMNAKSSFGAATVKLNVEYSRKSLRRRKCAMARRQARCMWPELCPSYLSRIQKLRQAPQKKGGD